MTNIHHNAPHLLFSLLNLLIICGADPLMTPGLAHNPSEYGLSLIKPVTPASTVCCPVPVIGGAACGERALIHIPYSTRC